MKTKTNNKKSSSKSKTQPQYVIVIGASAGGLNSFQKFFLATPVDTGFAFIVIQHLDPEHDSILPEILSRYTSMPLIKVEIPETLKPNNIYVISSGSELVIEKQKLVPKPLHLNNGIQKPVDKLLISIAAEYKDKAVGIICSGTGNDGSVGIKEIKKQNGLTIIQDIETCDYSDMPRNALHSSIIDYYLPPEDMPKALIQHALKNQHSTLLKSNSANYIDNIIVQLKAHTGQDFKAYKKKTIERRINRRISLHQLSNEKEYLEFLRNTPKEYEFLLQDLLIGVTHFFREQETWTLLEQKIIKPALRNYSYNKQFRMWVPACSTGEEAYSLAITFLKNMKEEGKEFNFQIFATDVDTRALSIARKGLYGKSIKEHVPKNILEEYFNKHEKGYYVKEFIKEHIIFSKQNVLTDPPFSKIDILSCKNLLIYIEPEEQKRLLRLFHFSLRPQGTLLLGNSETIGYCTNIFEPIEKKSHIYRCLSTHAPYNLSLPTKKHKSNLPTLPLTSLSEIETRSKNYNIVQHIHKNLIEEYTPPSVVINHKMEVIFFSGDTSPYLTLPRGTPTTNIFSLAKEGIAARLRTLIYKACQKKAKCSIKVAQLDKLKQIKITAIPFHKTTVLHGMFIISFQDEENLKNKTSTDITNTPEDNSLIKHLEQELVDIKEDLSSTIEALEISNEELKASNEEIMSINEELKSSNEELETSKEELQALNEELMTVNNQLQEKVEALEISNSDLQNFMTSTDLPTLFLDSQKNIRKYTPATKRIMGIIDTDIGRPLQDIALKIDDSSILSDIDKVLTTNTPQKKLTQGTDGSWYQRSILPYQHTFQEDYGTVLVFHNLTEIIKAKQEQEIMNARLHTTLNFADLVLWDWDLTTNKITWAGNYQELLNIKDNDDDFFEILNKIMSPQDVAKTKKEINKAKIKQKDYYEEWKIITFNQEKRWLVAKGNFIYNQQNKAIRMLGAIRDTTQEKNYQFKIISSEKKYKETLDSITDAFFSLDNDFTITYFNPSALKVLNINLKDVINKNLFDAFPEAKDSIFSVKYKECILQRKNAEFKTFFDAHQAWYNVRVFYNKSNKGISVFFRDTTEEKKLEEEIKHKKNQLIHSEKMRIIGQLAGGIAHDFNNQLSGVMGFAEMLEMKLQDPALKRYAQKIVKGVEQSSSLTRKILDFSRKGKILSISMDVHDLIYETIEILKSTINKNISINKNLTSPHATIIGDPGQLQNVLLNISINARDAMTQGGHLTFATYQKELTQEYIPLHGLPIPPGTYITIKISDTGTGIEPCLINKIFEPFFTTKNQGEGCGMGLASVLGAIEAHKGAIEIHTKMNQGTTITLYLPLSFSTITKHHLSTSTPLSQGEGTILLVDDEEIIREMLSDMLQSLGYKILIACNGIEALDIYQKKHNEIDLIILDLIMPEMSGNETFLKIKEINPKAKAILSSGYIFSNNITDESRQNGIKGFISKPYNIATLSKAILKALT